MGGAVLVVGATGNIGVPALKTGRHVIAPVRNSASAAKLFQHVGTQDSITTVETDVVTVDRITNAPSLGCVWRRSGVVSTS